MTVPYDPPMDLNAEFSLEVEKNYTVQNTHPVIWLYIETRAAGTEETGNGNWLAPRGEPWTLEVRGTHKTYARAEAYGQHAAISVIEEP